MPASLPALPADPGDALPGVSVIIAARNAARTLPACLDSLGALDYPDVEVIVVDDGSDDATAAIARQRRVRLLASPRRGPSAARNFGMAQASNDIVAFTDADCAVPRHWLRALVEGLRTSRAAGAGGPQRNVFPADAGDSARDLDLFFALASVVAEYTRSAGTARMVDHNASCNVAYIKHAVAEAGAFAEDLFPGEDVDLDLRLRKLGYQCYYVPEAWVEHHRPGTREWFAGMMRRYGRAQRALVDRHGRFRALHYFPMALGGLALVQLLCLPSRTRPLALALDGLLLAAGLALLAKHVPLDRWPAVLDYAAVATLEWNRGFSEGLRSL
jgi:glycosyltransferase involved in cell wall biosynthesis